MFTRLPLVALLLLPWMLPLRAAGGSFTGQLTDPQGKPVAGAKLRLIPTANANPVEATSDPSGRFIFSSLAEGTYQLTATAVGFADVKKAVRVGSGEALTLDVPFARLASRADTVNVTADVKDIDVQAPDP